MITLIHGGESYLVDRATRDLLQPLRTGLTLEFNYEDLQADSVNADAMAEKAGTLPFIVASRLGRAYLKTTADGDQPDNLLALPECQ
ncbi:MAG: DUF3892 domain-containing protein [Candidatus Dormibacteraeota bacterium]|nr:DUF3892 domain-containing protein [Candidatus Dormibacteraeota bacterium]